MVRVYLDWNVFSYLKHFRESKEPYISLDRILRTNNEHILIPYTSAHLTDLIPAYKHSEAGRLKTVEDLDYLADLTEHRCIIHNVSEDNTYPDYYNINEYFEQLVESYDSLPASFENIFDGTGMEFIQNPMLETFKLLPSGFPIKSLYDDSQNTLLNKMLPGLTESSSYYDVLKNTYEMTNRYNNEPVFYRSIRNSTLEQLNISNDYTQSRDPINTISEVLKSSAFQKSFSELTESILKNYYKDKEPSRFDKFTAYYIALDFLGFYRDKVFKNMLQDSFHAYYGAHCDFFVTDDDNTYNKAKALYEHFNIETIVCKTSQFVAEFYGKVIMNTTDELKLPDVITDIITNSLVLRSTYDENFNQVDIYKVNHYVLSFFNRLQVTQVKKESIFIALYKNSKNYSNFNFFKEIESIVNKIVAQFGPDLNARTNYIKDIETKELVENNWEGRHWQFGNTILKLQMKESPFGLTFTMEIKLN